MNVVMEKLAQMCKKALSPGRVTGAAIKRLDKLSKLPSGMEKAMLNARTFDQFENISKAGKNIPMDMYERLWVKRGPGPLKAKESLTKMIGSAARRGDKASTTGLQRYYDWGRLGKHQ